MAVLAGNPERPTLSTTLDELTMPDNIEPVARAAVSVALSADGSRLAFVGRGPAGEGIYLRELSGLDTRFIRGTEGALAPLFSPDGNWLLFSDGRALEKGPDSRRNTHHGC